MPYKRHWNTLIPVAIRKSKCTGASFIMLPTFYILICIFIFSLLLCGVVPIGIPHYVPKKITSIKLDSAHIGRLPSHGFCHLSHIRYILISSDNIYSIHSDAFQCMGNLVTLALTRCEIKSLPDGVFKYLRNLRSLDLTGKHPYDYVLLLQP